MAIDYRRITDLTIPEFQALVSETVKMNLQEHANTKEGQIKKNFYSAKEFGFLTGTPYSTVVSRCKNFELKSRQEKPGSNWYIEATELDRYKNEANDNTN